MITSIIEWIGFIIGFLFLITVGCCILLIITEKIRVAFDQRDEGYDDNANDYGDDFPW